MSDHNDRIAGFLTGIRYRTIAKALVLMVFAAMFVGMISARTCVLGTRSERMQIAVCSLSITVLTPFRGEEFKRPVLYAQRAIARANLGQTEAARRDMETALYKATFGQPRLALKGLAIDDVWKPVPLRFLAQMDELNPQSPAGLV